MINFFYLFHYILIKNVIITWWGRIEQSKIRCGWICCCFWSTTFATMPVAVTPASNKGTMIFFLSFIIVKILPINLIITNLVYYFFAVLSTINYKYLNFFWLAYSLLVLWVYFSKLCKKIRKIFQMIFYTILHQKTLGKAQELFQT